MPQLDIYLDEHDKRSLVGFLCREGFVLVPGNLYPEPIVMRCTTPEEFDRVGALAAQTFLVRADYECCPLELSWLPTQRLYSIIPRNGGPTIDISWAWEGVIDGRRVIREGFVAHYPSYLHTTLNKMIPVPPELRAAYRRIVAFLKRGSSRAVALDRSVNRSSRNVWAGPHVSSEWRKGQVQLLTYGSRIERGLVDDQRSVKGQTAH